MLRNIRVTKLHSYSLFILVRAKKLSKEIMTFSRGPLRVFVMFITIAVCLKNFSIEAFSTPVSKVNGICNGVHVCANMNTKKIGSSLFMAGYVPDGLTREEYEQIKAKERAEVKKKNFAMFGPRFKPTGAPEGMYRFIYSIHN